MTTGVFMHPVCEGHDMGAGHPECPQRLKAADRGIRAVEAQRALVRREPEQVQRTALLRVHPEEHIARIEGNAPAQGRTPLDPDTAMNPFTLEAARRAAGSATGAVEAVLDGELDRAFCAVRPPGHHAEYRRPMGFCFFNNVACGAAHALARGLSRVAILDFDVHHGNGTEDIFRDDPRVLFCSSFQHPFYPGTPLAERDHLVHVPLPAGTDGTAFRRALDQQWWPAINRFEPELILISAGFDAHRDDPLAELQLLEDDFRWVTARIVEMAQRHCSGRIVSLLEGGYDLPALEHSVAAHVDELCRDPG